MSDFAVQKPTRTISLGFGSSSEAVVKQDRLTDPNIAFRYSKKPSQNKRFVYKHRAVSLSLSLSLSLSFSLLLRPAIKVCKQFGSRRSSDVPDQGQTCIPCKSYNLVRLCVRWKEHFRQVPSFRCMPWADPKGGQGVRAPWKITKI